MKRLVLLVTVLALIAASAGATRSASAKSEAQAKTKTMLHVDDGAAPGGDGSAGSPFNTIAGALSAATTISTSVGVVIKVAAGDYVVSSSLSVDRPLELRGSSILTHDIDGWPTGVLPGTETRIVATGALGAQPVLAVGRSDAAVISDVDVRGFVFHGTLTGVHLLVTRVQGFSVKDNAFLAPGLFAVQSVASSGSVVGNYLTGVGTGVIAAGGYPESPSVVTITGNRSVLNNLGGVLLNGASIGIPELGDQLDAVVRNNDLSGNTTAQGFGARVFILRRDAGLPGDSQSTANIRAVIQDNRIVGNRVGISIDAGFPYRRVGTTCDPRTFSGTMDLTLKGNSLTGSVLTPALVSFTRSTAALAPATVNLWQYLHGASINVTDRDGTLAGLWLDHPELDPFVGPCPGDAAKEALGNTFTYNGEEVPYGRNF